LHQRAEAPGGWRTENVQARHRGLEALFEPRVTVKAINGLRQFWREKFVLGDVNAVSGSQQEMIYNSLGAVIQANPNFLPGHTDGNDAMSEPDGSVLKPFH
jgi:hypothetical protein